MNVVVDIGGWSIVGQMGRTESGEHPRHMERDAGEDDRSYGSD